MGKNYRRQEIKERGKMKQIFDAVTVGFLLMLSVNLAIIFFLAAANGGETTVTVNTYGKQAIETHSVHS